MSAKAQNEKGEPWRAGTAIGANRAGPTQIVGADLFIRSDDWEHDWSEQNLPDDFHDVLAKMGEALHDTVDSPDVARNFGRLPEQLLECAERLET